MNAEELKQRLHMFRAGLILADREGYEVDMPEGCRYILVSETLTQQLIDTISCTLDHLSTPERDPNFTGARH